jgi:hypothetical protein
MTIARLTRGFLASAALAAGLAIGIAANAAAQPTQSDKDADFLQCLVDHQDTDGIGVCCVFYGGDYDEPGEACYYDWAEEKAPEARPTKPVLTVPRAPIVAVASRA